MPSDVVGRATKAVVGDRVYTDAKQDAGSGPFLVVLETCATEGAAIGDWDFPSTAATHWPDRLGGSSDTTVQDQRPPWSLDLDQLATLTNDWDGYGALAPNATAIDNARRVAEWLMQNERALDRVVASAEGGVAVYVKNGPRYGSAECLNDGSVVCGASDRQGNVKTWESTACEGDVGSAIRELLGFVDA